MEASICKGEKTRVWSFLLGLCFLHLLFVSAGCNRTSRKTASVASNGRSAQTGRSPGSCDIVVRGSMGTSIDLTFNMSLPSSPMFSDPVQLPAVSLSRQRYLAARYVGRRRWEEMSQLAAMLWKLAGEKSKQAEALAASRSRDKHIFSLRNQAHAHLMESVALLEQVIRENSFFYLARLRLAYYLMELVSPKAVIHLKRLVDHPEAGRMAKMHRLALVHVLIRQGRVTEAMLNLNRLGSFLGADRLRALVLWGMGAFDGAARALLTAALNQGSKTGSSVQSTRWITAVFPRFLAMTTRPALTLRAWANAGSGFRPGSAKKLYKELARQLLLLGRCTEARVVLSMAGLSRKGVCPSNSGSCALYVAKRTGFCLTRHATAWLRAGADKKTVSLKCGLDCRNKGCISKGSLGDPRLDRAAICICRGLDHCAYGRSCSRSASASIMVQIKK